MTRFQYFRWLIRSRISRAIQAMRSSIIHYRVMRKFRILHNQLTDIGRRLKETRK